MITQVALCHLPDHEIQFIFSQVQKGMTAAFTNEAGFVIYRFSYVPTCQVLMQILNKATTDYVLFDVAVDPDPELEIFE